MTRDTDAPEYFSQNYMTVINSWNSQVVANDVIANNECIFLVNEKYFYVYIYYEIDFSVNFNCSKALELTNVLDKNGHQQPTW